MAAKINTSLEGVDWAGYMKPEALPKPIKGAESLRGKKLLMVDDGQGVLAAFIPDLEVATNGNAEFVLQSDQNISEVVEDILGRNPDVVLMDYSLKGMIGPNVIKVLKERGFQGRTIGFSNDPTSNDDFEKAGVSGSAFKSIKDPKGSILEVAKILSSSETN